MTHGDTNTSTTPTASGTAGTSTTSPGPLDLSLLRTFLAVHRAGSFTSAGRLLGLSQPTVTTQIRSLEGQLGRELFERRSRGVVPTAVADQLAAQVAAPLDALAAVADRGAPGTDQPRNPCTSPVRPSCCAPACCPPWHR